MGAHIKNMKSLMMWAVNFVLITTTLILINPVSGESDETPTPSCSKSDRDALLGFTAKISKDTTGFLDTWNNASDCCSGAWEGVLCAAPAASAGGSGDGRVSGLTLQRPSPLLDSNNDLYMTGSLSPSLGNLQFLDTLIVTGMRRISGNIPERFSNLTRLTSLVLDDNSLQGHIPSSLGQLKNLQALSLSGNHLTGQIPTSFGYLRNLSQLNLARNLLTGMIPPALIKLTGLKFLDLSCNSLSGPIPSFLGQLRNLTYLVLSKNQFSGQIPPSLFLLSQLTELSLDQNQLTGKIPAGINKLNNVNILRLSSNKLTGRVPASISTLMNLWNLNLSRNLLTSPLPDKAFATGLPALLSIDLSYNNLTLGSVPGWIHNRKLSNVLLAGCNLRGPLPNFTMPESLNTIDLSDNYFATGISSFLERMTYLNTVNISNNLLRDDISTIRLPGQISILDLSSNRLFGSFPRILTNGTNKFLEVIELSRNNISGSIPEFKSGLKLKVLNLGCNKLSGYIPSSVSELDKLERFDIMRNRVTGSIPTGLGLLIHLQWLDLSINGLKGKIPEIWNGTLRHASFRANNLCGPIPQIRPFNIFPAVAYAHNWCLCGKPLKSCNGK